MDDINARKCTAIRGLLSDCIEEESSVWNAMETDGESVADHMQACISCQDWHQQSTDMITMARSLPQFDVSERLTQNILSEVAAIDRARPQHLRWLVYSVVLTVFVATVLVIDAAESVWGIGSWIIGLATMIGIKLLISDSESERQTV